MPTSAPGRLVSGVARTHARRMVAGGMRCVVAALALVLSAAEGALGDASTVPATLTDVSGAVVDVQGLAERSRLVFVTVKATWCPVCRAQLRRIGRAWARFRACGATFVVLVPGTRDVVAALAADTGFPYPFVADEARAVADAAGLASDGEQLVPGFFVVDAARAVAWTQRGRADGAFGDAELASYLGCKDAGPDLLASAARGAR